MRPVGVCNHLGGPGTAMCSTTGNTRNVTGVAVPVVLHMILHAILQGALRNAKGVAVPVILHEVLDVVLYGSGFRV